MFVKFIGVVVDALIFLFSLLSAVVVEPAAGVVVGVGIRF